MRSKFAIAGRPIHPYLVMLPIALFTWSFVAGIVYLAGGREQLWYDLAYWTAIAGVISAVVAAIPGFGDYVTVASKSDASVIATAHMALNLLATALFFVTVLLMFDRGATGDLFWVVMAMKAIALGAIGISGWLGGDMVYRHHIGKIADDEPLAAAERSRHELPRAEQTGAPPNRSRGRRSLHRPTPR
jgi:uncharacterized membrane protein